MRTRVRLEIWTKSPVYPDRYLVSSFGRVKRIDSGHVVAENKNKNGYSYVHLSRNNVRKAIEISVLVCWAFKGPRPSPCHEVNHKDGDKGFNSEWNLEWLTPKQNTGHAIENGLKNDIGENNSRAREYIFIAPSGKRYRVKGRNAFCRKHKLDPSTVSRVAVGKEKQHKGWRVFNV